MLYNSYNGWIFPVFSGVVEDDDNEPLPPLLHLLGCMCGAGHPPGSGVAFQHVPFPHGPVGSKRGQSVPPRSTGPQMSEQVATDEQLWAAPLYTGSLFPLPSLHSSPLWAGAAQPGAALGVALLGKGGRLLSYFSLNIFTLLLFLASHTHSLRSLVVGASWLRHNARGVALLESLRVITFALLLQGRLCFAEQDNHRKAQSGHNCPPEETVHLHKTLPLALCSCAAPCYSFLLR